MIVQAGQHYIQSLGPGDESSLLNLGVPNVIVSDGGPQYTSTELKDFMKQWQIEHRVSAPRNPQSNGMAERCVHTMKASLIKTMEEEEDMDLALFTCKATP